MRPPYDVLVVIDHYLPGRKFGGPVTTVENMVTCLGRTLRFLILTRNRDLDGTVYGGVLANRVTRVGEADVLYLDDAHFHTRDLLHYARLCGAPLIYLNSFFSPLTLRFLLLRRLGLLRGNVVLAPRGEFGAAAYTSKGAKKRIYRHLVEALGLLRGVRWQVSSGRERQELLDVMGAQLDVVVAPDVFVASTGGDPAPERDPRRLIYLSRLTPKKNLLFALEVLRGLPFPVSLDIYGPREDPVYWAQCEALMGQLPPHVQVAYRGAVEHHEVRAVFARYGAFLFPTLNENYGHVIPEALAAGTPVILSDQTPWQNLAAAGVGWVLPLDRPELFREAVEYIARSSEQDVAARAERCLAYARTLAEDTEVLQRNLALFTRPFAKDQHE